MAADLTAPVYVRVGGVETEVGTFTLPADAAADATVELNDVEVEQLRRLFAAMTGQTGASSGG